MDQPPPPIVLPLDSEDMTPSEAFAAIEQYALEDVWCAYYYGMVLESEWHEARAEFDRLLEAYREATRPERELPIGNATWEMALRTRRIEAWRVKWVMSFESPTACRRSSA